MTFLYLDYMAYHDYNAGHPWYYKLGGAVLKPKAILEAVKVSGYQGYLAEDIAGANNKTEPQRSMALREIKEKVLVEMWRNISSYRTYASQLRKERQGSNSELENHSSNDLHMSMSLKHNHIYNDLAHLHNLDRLLDQFELF